MEEKYVIAVKHKDENWVYFGYKYDEMGYQVPALVSESRAMAFATIEQAHSWYEGAKKYISYEMKTFCVSDTLCVQRRIVQYNYQTIEFI